MYLYLYFAGNKIYRAHFEFTRRFLPRFYSIIPVIFDAAQFKGNDCNKMYTLTSEYLKVKSPTIGSMSIMEHWRIRIALLISQLSDTTQGRSSTQLSQPSGHCKHSKTPSTS